ncbi:MAG: PAS domain S-box protein [Deltaproteobacteria bacterium]|nr:PAS domain S-box protein [Deltaproteobacteria bacterium]
MTKRDIYPAIFKFIYGLISFLIGAVILSLFSILQKLIIGAPLVIKGFIVPFSFGGCSGFVIAIWRKNIKRYIKELTIKEEQIRNLIDNIHDMIQIVNPDGHFFYVNNLWKRLLGYSDEEIKNLTLWDIIHPNYIHYSKEIFEKLIKGENVLTFENLFVAKDGTLIPVEVNANFIFEGEKPKYSLCVVRDITKRKKTEESLKIEQESLKTILEYAPFGIVMISKGGKYQYLNPKFKELFGYTLNDIPDRNSWFQKAYPDIQLRNRVITAWEEDLRNSTTGEIGPRIFTVTCKDGTKKIINFRGVHLPSGENLITLEDITKQKEMEEELFKARKLESVGVLAGGIAHDFNNLLTAILGNISLVKITYNDKKKSFQRLEEAEKACLRAKDLTYQLLTFSKGGVPVRKTASITELVKDSTNFALRGSNVKAEFLIPDDLLPVNIDKGQISQVINNIVINAVQAMPERGIIKIKAENYILSDKNPFSLKAGKYLRISISDQGIGIPEENISKIFDPYFTTKEQGNGLGLATSYSIVKNHGGKIVCESKVGSGSTFYIYLPVSGKDIIEKKLKKPVELKGKGRILVMDDEEMIRDVVSEILIQLGYEPLCVKDGKEAIDEYQKAKKEGNPFDLILLDLTVPGNLGGKETIKIIKEIDPNVKAIVASGYSTDPIMANYKEYGFKEVIKKPYKIKLLSEILKKVIQNKN